MKRISYKKWGRSVKTQRMGKQLGLRDAAKEIGISSATLSRVERGHNISVPIFLAVEAWRGLNLYWMFK